MPPTYTSAQKRRVYLACRLIFTGVNAEVRKQKKIRSLVERHSGSLSHVTRDLGVQNVVEILKTMLEDRIFQSEIRAKVYFPELFQSSPARDVQRAASEIDAARSTAEALEDIVSLDGMNEDEEEGGGIVRGTGEPADLGGSRSSRLEPGTLGVAREQESTPDTVPSLYPSYLPYNVQHLILNTAQTVLEECCYDFAKKWLPSLLQENGWDCASAVELIKWTRIFAKRSTSILPVHAFELRSEASLTEILFATHKLRHTAVHRLPTTARGIHKLIQSAMKLAEVLQDTARAAQLEDLQYEIDSKVKAMELNKNVLENTLGQELREIARQREELQRKERRLIEGMKKDDANNKVLVGILLSDSVRRIFGEAEKESNGEAAAAKGEEIANGVMEPDGGNVGPGETPAEEALVEELTIEKLRTENERPAGEALTDESQVEEEYPTPQEEVEDPIEEIIQEPKEEQVEEQAEEQIQEAQLPSEHLLRQQPQEQQP